MTYPPESRRPDAQPHFAPYPVPQATAILPAVPPGPVPTTFQPGPAVWPPPARPAVTSDASAAFASPFDAERGEDLPPVRDPRVAAFGAGPVTADPTALQNLVRWGLPAATGVVGLLLGVVLASGGERSTAPVPISVPGVTETVTATPTVGAQAAVSRPARTVTRRVTTTAVQVTTVTPPAPPAVTVTETVRRTVTAPARRVPNDRRQPPVVPVLPGG